MPRVPAAPRSGFAIVENTSTDSTGVLPLGAQYAAEPTSDATVDATTAKATAQRPAHPSFVEGAPAFAERTPSFPDASTVLADARPPMRSHPENAGSYGVGSPAASYPPAPGPHGVENGALAAGEMGGTTAPLDGPQGEGVPYSAPPPPLALGAPTYGEIRTTGALPLVHPKRSITNGKGLVPPGAQPPTASQPPNAYGQPPTTSQLQAAYGQPPTTSQLQTAYGQSPATSQPPTPYSQPPPPTTTIPPPVTTPPPPAAEGDVGPTKVGDPIVVPISSIFTAGAALIAMAVMAFFVGRCSVAPAPSAGPARIAFATLPRLARAGMPAAPKPCWMSKQPVRWAPSAVQSVPVDVAPTPSGVIVAYARDAREPATVEVNFATGAFDDKPADKREGDVVRLLAPRGGAAMFVTTASDAGPLAPYVYAPAAPPFVIGISGRGTPTPAVAIADKPEDAPQTLWTVPAIDDDKGLESPRMIATGPSAFGLVFRRSGGILAGYVADKKASGGLTVVAGSGGSAGRPAIGVNGREVAVVFGDRQSADASWEIRAGHAPLGKMPSETSVVPLPKGGPGGDAFGPDVAGIADGRWVIVWTEGKQGSRAVRAQTFGPDFQPIGDPIAISPPAGNFGQAVVGVAGSYVTTMFLSRGTSGSYELWGAVLQCGS